MTIIVKLKIIHITRNVSLLRKMNKLVQQNHYATATLQSNIVKYSFKYETLHIYFLAHPYETVDVHQLCFIFTS
jgi:hypothetical protein